MTIKVYNVYRDNIETFSGNPEMVGKQLSNNYPFLNRRKHESLQDLIYELSRNQSFFVEVED